MKNMTDSISRSDTQKSLLLETTDLCIGYTGKNQSTSNIAGPMDLELVPGKMICLLGANGSGKSTLIRTLSGLQPPVKGSVKLDGKLLSSYNPARLATRLSLVLTEAVKSWNLDVYSLVSLGRFPYTGWLGNLCDQDRAIIEISIRSAQLEELVHRQVDELSDGERQRVMLARALAQDTAIIILDEPTAHLDLAHRIELMSMLHSLSRTQQKSILLSTHELDLALQVADEIWLLDGTGGLLKGSPEDLVLNDHFSRAFDKAGTLYDKLTGTFKITHAVHSGIQLRGNGIPAFWTSRALQRAGYSINSGNSPLVVSVHVDEDQLSWTLEGKENSGTQTCYSIHELLQALPGKHDL